MPPKKGSRSFPYQNKFNVEFGLRVTARNATTSLVEAAVCRFWGCWGLEADFSLMNYRRNSYC
jgi:hypothetical protein